MYYSYDEKGRDLISGGRTRTKRSIASLIFALACALFFVSCASRHLPKSGEFFVPSSWGNNPLVQTKYGTIRGKADKENTFSWKGIPYAQPPVGRLRFHAPLAHWPWKGVLQADSYGGKPVQFLPFIGSVIGSEDCLFLNVMRPRTKESNLPVYVWIYGGGNSIGSADFVPDYYGYGVSSKSDMVFVSMNYRLGILGWLYHPALGEGGSKEDASGNYGTLDIILALKWVQENIESFGGDPGCVTIAGESAGAFNVMSLLTSPLAKGLFHRAVIESGRQFFATKEKALAFSDDYIAKLLVHDKKAKTPGEAAKLLESMSLKEIRSYLETESAGNLESVLKPGTTGMTGTPSIIGDGYVLPEGVFSVFETGAYPNKVPVIIGTNKEEMKLFLSFDPSLDYKSELYAALAKYSSLIWKVDGADGIAQALASRKDQPPVYVYRFDWGATNKNNESPLPGDWPKKLGAFHSLEIPFFLGTDTILGSFMTGNLFTDKNKEGRVRLTHVIMSYLSRFARSGDPNNGLGSGTGESLPEWKPWRKESKEREAIVFDVEGNEPAISFLAGVLTRESVTAEMKEALSPELYPEVEKGLGIIHR